MQKGSKMIINEAKLKKVIRKKLIEFTLKSFGQSSSSSGSRRSRRRKNHGEEGGEFVVAGVRFQSVPAVGAANVAVRLYQEAEAAGQNSIKSSWEKTTTGRAWISNNIYDASKAGSGEKYGKLLGTDRESPWSSWFFSVCYKEFSSEGGHGSNHYDYGADEGLIMRKDILENPESHVGKVAFVTFGLDEAPVFKGDAVFGFREGSGSKLLDIASGKPSHMRIFGDNNGTVYGGNESGRVGVGSVKLTTNNTVKLGSKYGQEPYVAVYKRVKVIGRVEDADESVGTT